MKKRYVVWKSKHFNCHRRILDGLSRHGRKRLRFLTLQLDYRTDDIDINNCFVKLRKRVKRLTKLFLLENGYLTYNQIIYYYGVSSYWDDEFPFDYLKVFTSEAQHGVLHILYFGKYLPHAWIFDSWSTLQGLDKYVDLMPKQFVDIRDCKARMYDKYSLSKYCINQYVAGQDGYIRFNCSSNWCFKHFASAYDDCKKNYRMFYNFYKYRFTDMWDNEIYMNVYPQAILEECGVYVI